MNRRSARSQLHLQMGQEVIYLLMGLGLVAALLLAAVILAPMECSSAGANSKAGCNAAKAQPTPAAAKPVPPLPPKPAPPPRPAPPPAELPVKPPILNLTESAGYHFASGSMELSPEFQAKLQDVIIPEILELSAKYRTDVIEVIGHTDGVPVRQTVSSMDQRLMAFLNGSVDEAPPLVSDNIGLGMGRAAAIIRALRANPAIRKMTLLPLSAGQTTGADDQPAPEESSPAAADEQRRRIEIRLRRKFEE